MRLVNFFLKITTKDLALRMQYHKVVYLKLYFGYFASILVIHHMFLDFKSYSTSTRCCAGSQIFFFGKECEIVQFFLQITLKVLIEVLIEQKHVFTLCTVDAFCANFYAYVQV